MKAQSLQGDAAFSTFLTMCSWKATRFGALFPRRREIGKPDAELLSVFLEKGVVPRSEGDGNNNRPGDDLSKYLVVHRDDLVFNKLRTWQGGFGVSQFDGIVSPAYFVCQPNDSMCPRFVGYLLRSHVYLAELTRISKWMPPSQFDIAWEDLRTLPIVTPDIATQRRISDFLDHESAEANALVTKYERLIELLDEKRVTSITQAVTKGLDPNVPMTDSGIEWIGRVPEHWAVLPVRRIAKSVETGGTPPESDFSADGVPWYTPGDFRGGIDLTQSEKYVTKDGPSVRSFPKGSILVVGIGATLGKVGLPASESSSNQQCNAVIPQEGFNARFLAYTLVASYEEMRSRASASTLPILNQSKMKGLELPVAPRAEQEQIATWIDRRIAEISVQTEKAKAAMALVAEHRSALITAAVTGQIDVTNSRSSKRPLVPA